MSVFKYNAKNRLKLIGGLLAARFDGIVILQQGVDLCFHRVRAARLGGVDEELFAGRRLPDAGVVVHRL